MDSVTKQDSPKEDFLWGLVKKDYFSMKPLGEGSYGQVMKCISKFDGKPYAIKLLANKFDNVHDLKHLVREIHIMR